MASLAKLRRSRIVRWIALAAGVVAVAPFGIQGLPLVGLLLVVVVPFERLFPRHKQRFLRPGLGTDLAYALLMGLAKGAGAVVAIPIAVASLMWVPGLALRPLVAMLPNPARVALGFLLFDALTYWVHRWAHRVPMLWRFHSIHHSSQRLDWLAGFRTHPFDGALLAPPFVFLLAAGFSTELTGVLAGVQAVTGLFIHANVRWRLRPLQRIVITPEFHHWHHSDEPHASNSNFSAFLPIWDILFRTWHMPADRRPTGYGIQEEVPPRLIGQLLHPLPPLRDTLRVLRHPLRSIRPGWRGLRMVLRQIRVASRLTPMPATAEPLVDNNP